MRTPKSANHDKEFIEKSVKSYMENKEKVSISEFARSLNVNRSALCNWIYKRRHDEKMGQSKPHYVDILDALNNLKDLIIVCSLAQPCAAKEELPMFVLNTYAKPEIERIKEMVKRIYEK